MDRLIWVSPKSKSPFRPEAAGEAAADSRPSDGVLSRVVKLIPTEIVAGYVPLVAAAEAFGSESKKFALALTAFAIGFFLTPLYLIFIGNPKRWFQWVNVGVSTIAFVLWAYLLGGPFAMPQMDDFLWPYDKQLAGFVVGAFTWVVGVFPYQNIETKKAGD